MLEINNLHASVDGTEILKGINLKINVGEVHAIMGPNGSGKSTLSKVIAGHPAYEVTDGTMQFDINSNMEDITELSTYERAHQGVFLGFQYPVEIPGVNNLQFLRQSFNAICKAQGVEEMDADTFKEILKPKLALLEMDESFLARPVNTGFSGGEKKKNEILQMSVLNPKLRLLDETDSGLDIDALRIVAKGVNSLKNKKNATVLITHYQRLLDYIEPDFIHVLFDGKIIKSGGKELALELEEKGYDWLTQEYN